MQNLKSVDQKWLIYEYFGLVFTFYTTCTFVLCWASPYKVPREICCKLYTLFQFTPVCYILYGEKSDFSKNAGYARKIKKKIFFQQI